MARKRFQQKGHLYQENGVWKLRWWEDAVQPDGTLKRVRSSPQEVGLGMQFPAALARRLKVNRLTRAEAEEIAWNEYLSDVNANRAVPGSQLTIKQFIDNFYRPGHIQTLRDPQTLESRLENHVLPILGDRRLRDVKKKQVRELLAIVQAKGLSPQTVLHIRNLVSGIFTFATEEECFRGVNPAKGCKLPPLTRVKQRHALNDPQVNTVIFKIAEPYKPIVRIAVLTSLTIGEILGLKWRYVNLSDAWRAEEAEPMAPWSFHVRGMIRKGRYQRELKADARKRDIPLPKILVEDLLWLRDREHFTGPDDFVFVSRNGTALDGKNILNRHLKPIGEKHGMPWLDWHCFRHTTATWADQNGMSAADRMALMGHSELRTTMGYTHSDLERRRAVMEQMAGRLDGKKIVEMPRKKAG